MNTKKLSKSILALVLGLFASVAFAGPGTNTGTITKVRSGALGVVIFTMSSTTATPASCHTGTANTFATDSSTNAGKAHYLSMMNAYNSNKAITVTGSDTCTSAIENIAATEQTF